MSEAYDWYRRNYPKGPEYEPRLFEVLRRLAHNGQIYNVYRAGDRRVDGGFEPWGNGVAVAIRNSVGSFDGGELTRLVLAAHQYQCRVEISPARGNCIHVSVTPRDPDGKSMFDRHPSLSDLIGQCNKLNPVAEGGRLDGG